MMRPVISSEERRALWACLQQSFYHFPTKLLILAAIAGSIIFYHGIVKCIQGDTSFVTIGFLSIGFVFVTVLLGISALFEGGERNLKSRFAFPINRKIYILAGFVAMLRDTAGLLMATTICTAVEIVMIKVMKVFRPDLIMINTVGMTDYWDGFWISFSLIACCYAFCFCLGIYLAKARIKTSIVLGILLVLLTSHYFRIDGFLMKEFSHLASSSSLPVFYSKIWMMTIIAYLLAYLPLRRLEV